MRKCCVPGPNHSTDLVSVYHGMTEPATACGFHAYYWPELVARAHRQVEPSPCLPEGQTAPALPNRQEEK